MGRALSEWVSLPHWVSMLQVNPLHSYGTPVCRVLGSRKRLRAESKNCLVYEPRYTHKKKRGKKELQGLKKSKMQNPLILDWNQSPYIYKPGNASSRKERSLFNRLKSGRVDSKAPGKFQTGHHIVSVKTENLTPVGSDRYRQSGEGPQLSRCKGLFRLARIP